MQKRKKEKRINLANHAFRIILLGLLSIFIGISLFVFNSKILLHTNNPTLGGYGVSVVVSGSMEPTININDLVIFNTQDSYEEGDIVVYREQNSTVIHRIIEFLNDDRCITKGDANNTVDKEINIKQIIGKMVFKIPFIGILINNISKYIFLFIIIILLTLSFIAEAKQRRADKIRTQLLWEEIQRLKKMNDTNEGEQNTIKKPKSHKNDKHDKDDDNRIQIQDNQTLDAN